MREASSAPAVVSCGVPKDLNEVVNQIIESLLAAKNADAAHAECVIIIRDFLAHHFGAAYLQQPAQSVPEVLASLNALWQSLVKNSANKDNL